MISKTYPPLVRSSLQLFPLFVSKPSSRGGLFVLFYYYPFVQLIDSLAVSTRYEMPVGIDCYLNRRVPHLLFDIGEAFAPLDEQASERMT
jgi:hypothetical protein